MEILVGIIPGIVLSILFLINDRKLSKEKIFNVIILVILGAIGFGAKGIIKGSAAAFIQSCYGLVKAGSWFAKLTSAAMKGA